MIANAEVMDVQKENAGKRMEYVRQKRSKIMAFLLWFLFGLIGAHNFYVKQNQYGLLKIVSLLACLFGAAVPAIGLVVFVAAIGMWIFDLFFIGKEVDVFNEHLRQGLGFYEPRDNVF